MSDTVIKTEDLRFSYRSGEDEPETVVLRGIDLTVTRGSFVAVLGHNGSGKSTFAKHLNAILLPSGGRVWVDGMDTADEKVQLAIRRTWWRRTWPSPRRIWGWSRRRSAAGWTTR